MCVSFNITPGQLIIRFVSLVSERFMNMVDIIFCINTLKLCIFTCENCNSKSCRSTRDSVLFN